MSEHLRSDEQSVKLIARSRRRVAEATDAGQARFARLRERVRVIDIAVRIYERDKEAAGTLLGSALALRLFLFFVPLVLTGIGIAGLVGRYGGVESMSSAAGVSGSLAREVDAALSQSGTAPWLAIVIGLFGVVTTGRSLTRALVLSSALSWELGGRQKVHVRSIGIVVGAVVGMALTTSILNRLRVVAGLAVASVSYTLLAALYLLLWVVLFTSFPRGTSDPGAALPGAATMALVMTAMQMVVQLYLPHQIESSSNLYGAVGVVVAFLGWFFISGRALAFSFALNAVLYEQIGSVSTFVFGLPGIRVIPRRIPWVKGFFDLDQPHE